MGTRLDRRAIASFPVPVSLWIRKAESTDPILFGSIGNAREFGMDLIKSKGVIAFSSTNAARSAFLLIKPADGLAFVSLSRDPLPYVRSAVHERDVSGLTLGEEDDPLFASQSNVL